MNTGTVNFLNDHCRHTTRDVNSACWSFGLEDPLSAQDSQHETDLDSSIILLINVIYFSVRLFLLGYGKTFKIVEIFFLLGYGYCSTSELSFFFFLSPQSVYFCCVTEIGLYFPVVMCELLYLYIHSKCSITRS